MTLVAFSSTLVEVDGFNIPLLEMPASDQGSSSSSGGPTGNGDISPPASPAGAAQASSVPGTQLDLSGSDQGSSPSLGGATEEGHVSPPASPAGAA